MGYDNGEKKRALEKDGKRGEQTQLMEDRGLHGWRRFSDEKGDKLQGGHASVRDPLEGETKRGKSSTKATSSSRGGELREAEP